MQLGLKRGTVALQPHQSAWEENAAQTVQLLRDLLGSAAVDVQHIGSTSIRGICAKPILDLVVGVRDFADVLALQDALAARGILYRGQDQPAQHLFVMGDFAADTRTHHIHVVLWGGEAWCNYVNFRDYLNAHEGRAAEYDALKRGLALRFAHDRNAYTAGKHDLIDRLLREACAWRSTQTGAQTP